jgi:hypothetical protein
MRLPTCVLFGGIACASWLQGARAAACDIAPPPTHEIVANPADTTRPTMQSAKAKVRVGRDPDVGCGGATVGSCDALTYITLQVQATDDVSAPEDLGYLLESDDAALYDGQGPVRGYDDAGRIVVYLNGTHEAQGEDFDVRVFAVDKAGNISEQPIVVTVRRSGGDGGCQIAASIADGSLWTLAMLALFARSQRRRANLTKA